MKHLLAALMALLLLTGCSREAPESPPSTAPLEPIPTAPVGLWQAGHPLEGEGLRVYPLAGDATGLGLLGDSPVLQAGTTLTALTGDALIPTASVTLPTASFTFLSDALWYLEESQGQLVVLDGNFKELRRIDLPEEQIGTPALSRDGATLYYCTSTAVKAYELTTGLHRTVAELSQNQEILGLHRSDTLLCLRTENDIQLRSTRDGALLWQGESLSLETCGEGWYAQVNRQLIFGSNETSQVLYPADPAGSHTFLPRQNACLSLVRTSTRDIRLDYYNLSTGRLQGSLALENTELLAWEGSEAGWVYLLATTGEEKFLYRWDPTVEVSEDGNVYTASYSTADHPDRRGLLTCQTQAAALGERYGLTIHLWDDALPQGYTVESEYRVSLLEQALARLETRLAQLPGEILAAAGEDYTGLTLYLVGSVRYAPEQGECPEYLEGTQPQILLPMEEDWEAAFYHGLYHVMETHILNGSTALDQWDKLNPGNFAYSCDYTANRTRSVGSWLDADIRCFVDRYAMSFPREDRATLFAAALTPGNETLFAASPLQNKLKQLCIAIRDAYGLEKHPTPLPWEAYLWNPLGTQ